MRKDDVVYYKVQLTKMLESAIANGVRIFEDNGRISFRRDIIIEGLKTVDEHYEQTTVDINKYVEGRGEMNGNIPKKTF